MQSDKTHVLGNDDSLMIIELSTDEDENDQPSLCLICGDNINGKKRGVNCCRKCYKFFLQTDAQGLTYTCQYKKDCRISKDTFYKCRQA